MGRGKLAFRSALTAADDGDIPRAVHQLRRLISFLGEGDSDDPVLFCRASERLAYFLLDIDEDAQAIAAAEAAVDPLPDEPPRRGRARAPATHARAPPWVEDARPGPSPAAPRLAAPRAA